MSPTPTIEERVAALEAEVARLKRQQTEGGQERAGELPWWEQVYGQFKDDPLYDEAMALGRQYRESLRPDQEAVGSNVPEPAT